MNSKDDIIDISSGEGVVLAKADGNKNDDDVSTYQNSDHANHEEPCREQHVM